MPTQREDLLDEITKKLLQGDGITLIPGAFPIWAKDHVVTDMTDFTGIKPLKEVFFTKSAMDTIMNQSSDPNRKFGGIALYQAIIEIPDEKDPTKKIKVATIGAVAVDDQGRAYDAQNEGAFFVSLPCPTYCPKWR